MTFTTCQERKIRTHTVWYQILEGHNLRGITFLKFSGNNFCGSPGFSLAMPTSGSHTFFRSNRWLAAATLCCNARFPYATLFLHWSDLSIQAMFHWLPDHVSCLFIGWCNRGWNTSESFDRDLEDWGAYWWIVAVVIDLKSIWLHLSPGSSCGLLAYASACHCYTMCIFAVNGMRRHLPLAGLTHMLSS